MSPLNGPDVHGYKTARAALGLTQLQVSTALGCALDVVKRIERGAVPYPSYVRRLYDLLLGFEAVESLRSDALESGL